MAAFIIEDVINCQEHEQKELLINSIKKDQKLYIRLQNGNTATSIWIDRSELYQMIEFLKTQYNTIDFD